MSEAFGTQEQILCLLALRARLACVTTRSSPAIMIMSLNDVLTNIDLLENIFKHSDYPQNYRNALVSKTWSNAALGVLWRNLDSFEPLLSLLSPMTVISMEGKAEYVRGAPLIREKCGTHLACTIEI